MIITEQGHKRIIDELNHIRKNDLVEASQRLEETRPYGVSDEYPPEYLQAIDNMNRVEKKISTLQEILSSSSIFNLGMILDKTKIGFGATVTYLNEDTDKEYTYKLVSSYESDISKGLLSIESPIGKEMIGASVDDIFEVNGQEYTIISIKY